MSDPAPVTKDIVVPSDRRFISRENCPENLLKLLGVAPEWGEKGYLRVFDKCDDLVLIHYLNTYVSETDHTVNVAPMEAIGGARGVIINTRTNKIVCRSFPFTPEAVTGDASRIERVLDTDFDNVHFYNACEGTVLRLFWSEKWYISTHRKIDANNSYWSGPTFGEMFNSVKQFDTDNLDKDLCYIFLISDNRNRLVYKVPEPQLMLLGIYRQSTATFLKPGEYGAGFEESLNPKGCVYPVPIEIPDLETLEKTVDEMEECKSFNRAGVIAFANIGDPSPVKIINPGYQALRDARGNEASLRTRYIQLRGTPQCELMIKWFDEDSYQDVFKGIEGEFENLVERLHKMYINRHIKKDYSELPKEEYVTLQRCHGWHTADRANNIVTREKVREFLNSTPTYFLQRMLNRQRREKKMAAKKAVSQIA